MEDMQDRTRNTRHTEVGLTVLEWMAQLLKQPEWSSFYSRFRKGSIGEGHIIPKRTKGETPKREIATAGGAFRQRPKDAGENASDEEDGGESEKDKIPSVEKKGHHPGTVESEEFGKIRSFIKNDSLGIVIGYSNMLGDVRAYVFEEERGRIIFNTSHPLFVRCDEAGPMKLARYEQFIGMSIIILHSQHEDNRHLYVKAFEELLKMEVFRIMNEPMLLRSRRK